jgi:hypothetical protein
MEYAIQLLLPVIGGLMLGNWLSSQYHVSSLWSVFLAIAGLFGGIGMLYKRYILLNPPRIIKKNKRKKPVQNETNPLNKGSDS